MKLESLAQCVIQYVNRKNLQMILPGMAAASTSTGTFMGRGRGLSSTM